MGLPFWPAGDDGTTASESQVWSTRPDTLDPERAAESLSVLASPVRLSVLAALHRRGALSYTELMDATGVEDRGRFNYHLRELGALVERGEDRYALSDSGERVVERVLAGGALSDWA